MTDLALPQPALVLAASGAGSEPSACSRKMSPSATPNKPAPPTRMNSRRLQPSHVQPGFPGIESIGFFCSLMGFQIFDMLFEVLSFAYRLNKNAGLFINAQARSCATSSRVPPDDKSIVVRSSSVGGRFNTE